MRKHVLVAKICAVAAAFSFVLPGSSIALADQGEVAADVAPSTASVTEKGTEAPAAPVASESAAPVASESAAPKTAAPESAVPEASMRAAGETRDSSLNVQLKLGELSGSTFAEGPAEYWSEEPIVSAADIDVSGKGAVISNAKLVITVPRTGDLVSQPDFAASSGASSQKLETTPEAWVKTFEYDSITGGFHATYPFPFHFRKDTVSGNPAKDRVTVDVKLIGADGTTLYSAEKTYVAKTAKFVPWSAGWDGVHDYDISTHSGKTYTEVMEGADRVDPARPTSAGFFLNAYLDSPEGVTSGYGVVQPKNIQITVDLPEGARFGIPVFDGTGKLTGYRDFDQWKLSADGRSGTMTIANPSFEWSHPVVTNGHYSFWNQPFVSFENSKLNTPLPIKIHYTVNAGLDNEYKLDDRTETITIAPTFYKSGGSFSIDKYAWPGIAGSTYPNSKYFDWSSHDYTLSNKKYFHRSQDLTDDGMMMVTRICGANNGTSTSDPSNGRTSKIYDVTHSLLVHDGEAMDRKYVGFSVLDFLTEGSRVNVASEPRLQATIDQFNNTHKILWGIDSEGNKTKLAEDFAVKERVEINDPTSRYVKLFLEFVDAPILLDNTCMYMGDFVHLTDAEVAKFEAEQGENAVVHSYFEDVSATYSIGYPGDPVEKSTAAWGGLDSDSTRTEVRSLQPKIAVYETPATTVVYKDGGTEFSLDVGQHGGKVWQSDNTWGDRTTVAGLKSITLLPAGIKLRDMPDSYYAARKMLRPTVIENFHGTGKTAIVEEYPDAEPFTNSLLELPLIATKDTEAGVNKVTTYLVYDDNDLIRPLVAEHGYTDVLDLDSDGDTSEIYSVHTSDVTFIPAYELILHNSVKFQDQAFGASTTGDLGRPVTKRISMFNNSVIEVKALSIIDVLPYAGDHSIAPNDANTYPTRGSTYATPLTGSLESVESNKGLFGETGRFDVFYQLTDQASTLGGVRDGAWVRAGDVSDFSKVKAFKIVLKSGSMIAVKETVNFDIPVLIPYSKELAADVAKSVAVNTSAFSTDGSLYSEGNRVDIRFAKYRVSGRAYVDVAENGVYDAGTDTLLPGTRVTLVKADNSTAVRPDDTEITALTDAQGFYDFEVYDRGDYRVRFTRPDGTYGYIVEPKVDEEHYGNSTTGLVSGINAAADQGTTTCDVNATSQTDGFALSPVTPEKTAHQALVRHNGTVSVVKTDKATGSPLAGVEFTLTPTAATNADGCPAQPITATTTDNGVASFAAVPYGSYSLAETKALTGYVLSSETHNVAVAAGNRAVEVGTVTNELKTGKIDVVKENERGASLDKATFNLAGTALNGQAVREERTTGANGTASFANIPYGTYTLTETVAPDGYGIPADGNKRTVTINDQSAAPVVKVVDKPALAAVKVVKTDGDGQPLADAVFTLTGRDVTGAEVSREAKSGTDGIATFADVPAGSYTVSEKTPPVGYLRSTDSIDVTVTGKEAVVEAGTIKDQIITGSVRLRKVDDLGANLAGVTFVLTQGGKEKYEAATNEQGIALFPKVNYGDYVVIEKRTLESHRLITKPVANVAVHENGKQYDLGDVVNEVKRGTIELTKTDSETTAPIAGVAFALIDAKGTEVRRFTTESDGKATFAAVPYGTYTIREIEAARGYAMPEVTDVEAKVTEDLAVASYSMTNDRAVGRITVTKQDAVTEKPLANAEFTLTGVDFAGKEISRTAVTNKEGIATFNGLNVGTYKVVESKAPKGYVLNDKPIEGLAIESDAQILDAGVVTDSRITGTVEFLKVDKANSKGIAGAEFTLSGTNIAGEDIERTAVSDEKGVVRFEDVDYGTYTVSESKAPVGYMKTDAVREVSVEEADKVYTLDDVVNERLVGQVRITKVDSATKAPLAGAEFVLEGKNLAGESVSKTVMTAEDGKAVFDGVEFGTYTVKETKAPKGYKDPKWTSEVVLNQTTVENGQAFTVENTKIPVKSLVFTGARVAGLGLLALVLLGAGGAALILKRRK